MFMNRGELPLPSFLRQHEVGTGATRIVTFDLRRFRKVVLFCAPCGVFVHYEDVCRIREGYTIWRESTRNSLRFGFLFSRRCCGEHSLSTTAWLSEPPLSRPSSSVVPQSGAAGPYLLPGLVTATLIKVFWYGWCIIFYELRLMEPRTRLPYLPPVCAAVLYKRTQVPRQGCRLVLPLVAMVFPLVLALSAPFVLSRWNPFLHFFLRSFRAKAQRHDMVCRFRRPYERRTDSTPSLLTEKIPRNFSTVYVSSMLLKTVCCIHIRVLNRVK